MNKEYYVNNMSNYYGNLVVMKSEDKYFWKVNCCVNQKEWYEIPKTLYLEIEKYCTTNNDEVRLVSEEDWEEY